MSGRQPARGLPRPGPLNPAAPRRQPESRCCRFPSLPAGTGPDRNRFRAPGPSRCRRPALEAGQARERSARPEGAGRPDDPCHHGSSARGQHTVPRLCTAFGTFRPLPTLRPELRAGPAAAEPAGARVPGACPGCPAGAPAAGRACRVAWTVPSCVQGSLAGRAASDWAVAAQVHPARPGKGVPAELR